MINAPLLRRRLTCSLRPGYKRRTPPPGLAVATHYTRALTDEDVHPLRQPRRTRIARSLVDAAAWMPQPTGRDGGSRRRGAAATRARMDDLHRVADRIETLHRRKLIKETIGDIAGGSQALSEFDFTRQVIRCVPAARAHPPGRPAVIAKGAGAGPTSCGTTTRSWWRSTAPSTQPTHGNAGTTWSATTTSAWTATRRSASPPGW